MSQPRRPGRRFNGERPALDKAAIEALALGYAGRYMTTRARLAAYLVRKVRERGGPADAAAIVAATVERVATLRYVDDAAYAASKAGALERRGYGARRIEQALRAAGVEPQDVPDTDEDGAWPLALRFARRRRIGPFCADPASPILRRRHFAAIVRAGHPPHLAARLLALDTEEANELIGDE